MSDLNRLIQLPFQASFKLVQIPEQTDSLLRYFNSSEQQELAGISNKKRRCEYVTSRAAIKQLGRKMGLASLNIFKDELGRPYALSEGQHYHVSIAHTDSMVFCGISGEQEIGIDLEPLNRTVPEKLMERITQPREKNTLSNIPPLRLWTIKEAVIKLEGQGLRLNMNRIYVQEENGRFFAEINNDKRAKICSFHTENDWLAIAYR